MEPQPLPRVARFERLAYGLFIHWGLYSLRDSGEWVQHHRRLDRREYSQLAKKFTAEKFDARLIARTARQAGMRYIVLTTRHHEGFSLYDTRGLSDFDAPHSAAGRDLVAEFVEGCRAEDIVPFFYHTTLDWYHPDFDKDFDSYLDYLHASVEVLCTNYGEVGGFWFDGNWSKPDADWKEDRLYSIIRRHQPEAIITNNTGLQKRGQFGHPEIDCVTFEQADPAAVKRAGRQRYVAAEACRTLNTHWGRAANDYDYMGPGQVIETLCLCRKVGANLLLNVGPTADGEIPEYERSVLLRAGEWVARYDEIIRNGKPCGATGTGRDFILEAGGKFYAAVFGLKPFPGAEAASDRPGPGPRSFRGLTRKVKRVRWLDNGEDLAFAHDPASGLLVFDATGYEYGSNLVVRVAELEVEG